MSPFHLTLLELCVTFAVIIAVIITPPLRGSRYRIMLYYCVSWVLSTMAFLLYFDLTAGWDLNTKYDWALVLGVLPVLIGAVVYAVLPTNDKMERAGDDGRT